MSKLVVYVAALAGFSTAANAQLMKMLVSTDGVTFSNTVNAKPGDTVQVLVTASYTGTSTTVFGFGSANFQATVSNWHVADALLPLLAGGNQTPNRIPANDSRRVNVELFRFGFTLDLTTSARDLVVDAPLVGQQISSNNVRYMGLYVNPVTTQPSLAVPVVVQTGVVHVIPSPGTVAALGQCGLATRRRRSPRSSNYA